MILLDTNVVSEPWRPAPDPNVRAWLNFQPRESLYLCAPVLAELRYGIEKLPDSARRRRLEAIFSRLEDEGYRERILPFDAPAASAYGSLTAARERIGRPIREMDALIAAIALTRGAKLATRDVFDFEDLGLDLINPFEAPTSG